MSNDMLFNTGTYDYGVAVNREHARHERMTRYRDIPVVAPSHSPKKIKRGKYGEAENPDSTGKCGWKGKK